MKNKLTVALLGLSIGLFSCNELQKQETQQTSSSGAVTVNVSKQFHIPVNAEGNTTEQQNIIDKNKVTSDPTKIMWMHLIDLSGRIYLRTPVRGKITSSSKRLEPASCAAGLTGGESHRSFGAFTPDHQERTSELIQIDGTYGTSDQYVYWFDPRGYYYQFGVGYILSDIPINTKDPINEITGLYNLDKAAKEWQDSQNKTK